MRLYKGNIIPTNCFPKLAYHVNFVKTDDEYYILDSSSQEVWSYFTNLNKDEIKVAFDDLTELTTVNAKEETKLKYDNLFKDIIKLDANNIMGTSIIYEKIYDKNENEYGKELISGFIFPINSRYSDYDIDYAEEESKNTYFDKKSGKGYYLYKMEIKPGSYLFYYYLVGMDKKEYQIQKHEFENLDFAKSSRKEYSVFLHGNFVYLLSTYPKNFTVNITPKMFFSPSQRIEYVIAGEKVANELEVKNYLNNMETGLFKKKRKRVFINSIKEKNISNYLGDEIEFVNQKIIKSRINEGQITKEMKELEYLLAILKTVSEEEYNKINSEYNEVLNNDKTSEIYPNPLATKTIINLQNKCKMAYICHGGNSKNILEFLDKQSKIYLNNLINNNEGNKELSIMDLDEITESFLKSKNNYSVKEQNEILRNLSFLYFFELYENCNTISSDDLVNSYVMDNIKRIITIIVILQDEEIINPVSNVIYDIKTIDELLELIKKIKFKPTDEIEKKENMLMKRMQQ